MKASLIPMQVLLITVSSSFFCAISRIALNIFDRHFLRTNNIDFLLTILLNSLFPLFFSIINCVFFRNFDSSILNLLTKPGIIFSGIGAQFAAYAVSKSLREMNIRNVMLSGKICDLFIPIIVFLLTHKFCLQDYFFISLTTLSFFPIALTTFRNGSLYKKASYILMISLVFQALINSYFEVPTYTQTWRDFSKFMVGVLAWRTILMIIVIGIRYIKHPIVNFQTLNVRDLEGLFLRGSLAFLSQSAFFFSITRDMSFIAWPILNAVPLLNCYAAHYFLKEKTGISEVTTTFFLVITFCSYLLIKGGYL